MVSWAVLHIYRVSKEENVEEGHTIIPDGYNIGRNLLVQNAVGKTSFAGVKYSTTAENITGLMAAGSDGVNHGECRGVLRISGLSVADMCTGIAVDGIVTLLTVTIE